MRTFVHVNQHVIRSNKKSGADDAPLTAKNYKGNTKAHRLAILDASGVTVAEIVYSPQRPLDCGAVCWIQTDLDVRAVE